MEKPDIIAPELTMLLLSLGFTGAEISQLQSYVVNHTEVHARPTARSFGGHVFGQPIKRRLPRINKRYNAEPAILIYTQQSRGFRTQKDLDEAYSRAFDPWWPLRALAAKGDPLDLNQIQR